MSWLLAAIALGVFPSAAVGELKPADISGQGESGSSPRIVSDGAGDIVAIWREVDGDTSAIRAAFRPAGESWRPAQRISIPALATESPRVAMDKAGNAVAVWQRSSGHDSVVQAAIRPAGGVWSEPEDLSGPGKVAFNADVAAKAGKMTAVWNVLRERRTVVESSSRMVAGPWAPAQTISAPVGNTSAAVVAVDDQGTAVASWRWSDGAFLVVQAAVRSKDGVWSAPEVLSGPGRSASLPRVAMDASGDAVVAWLRNNGSWTAAQVAYRTAAGDWEAIHNLSERGGNARQLDLAMNSRGDAVITWIQSQLRASANLWSSLRPAGSRSWSRVLVSAAWYGLDARIALDEQGNATAVWAGSNTISASFKPVGEPWQDDYLLSGYEFSTAQPAVTTQRPENATAAWVRSGETDDYVQAVSYDITTYKEEADEEETDEEEEEEEEEEEDEEEAEEQEEPTTEGQTYRGTSESDTFVGTPGNDIFYGYGGSDLIDGRGGRDIVYGGPGRDLIKGGTGSDRLFGGFGRDRIVGGSGSDALRGGPGADVLRGNNGRDVLHGAVGRESIDGGEGRDVVHGGPGADRIAGGIGADRLFGGLGRDRIIGGPGRDVLRGGPGADVLRGNGGRDVLRGAAGREVMDGGEGRDVVYGGPGADRIAGGIGADRLFGGFGRDRIRGGRGDDRLTGGRGQDSLNGGSGNDAFRARDRRPDTVFGGTGLDFYSLDRWLDRARSIESRL
jgi:Ca2+-binding RTX toxin-like protein